MVRDPTLEKITSEIERMFFLKPRVDHCRAKMEAEMFGPKKPCGC